MSDRDVRPLPSHRSEGKAARPLNLLGRAEQSSSNAALRRAEGAELDGESADRATIKVTAMRVVGHCPRDRVPDSTYQFTFAWGGPADRKSQLPWPGSTGHERRRRRAKYCVPGGTRSVVPVQILRPDQCAPLARRLRQIVVASLQHIPYDLFSRGLRLRMIR
jgi:hypothetical protein